MLRLGPNPSPLKVMDEHGVPIGESLPERIVANAEEHRPLAIAAAQDFARPEASRDA